MPSFSTLLPRPLLLLGLLGLTALVGCDSSSKGSGSGLPAGSIAVNPNISDGFDRFIVDQNEGGNANELKIVAVLWGRLVDVYDFNSVTGESTKLFRDLLVADTIESDGLDYRLDRNPITGREDLVILHPFGTAAFQTAFLPLEQDLQPFQPKSFNSIPPYTQLPRNAAMVVAFDDLLDDGGDQGSANWPGSVNPQTVLLDIGYPPSVPFPGRIIPDRNHGDLVGGNFHSTRVILDMTVSQEESQQVNVPVNMVGLPAAVNSAQANVALRLPTKVVPSAGQFTILRNLSQHGVAFNGNGPTNGASPTLDVVRVFRSGGSGVGDPYNGFLRDITPPGIVSSQLIQLESVSQLGPNSFVVSYSFFSIPCATLPRAGDLLVFSGGRAFELTADGAAPVAGVVAGAIARLRTGEGLPLTPTTGEMRTRFDPALGHVAPCFLTFSPEAAAGSVPGAGLSTSTSITLAFSEPMDPASVEAFETFRMIDASVAANMPLRQHVPGQISANQQLDRFTYLPLVPLNHTSGNTELFQLLITGGLDGITDLAGLPLSQTPATMNLTVAPTEPTLVTGGVTLRFTSPDEDGNGAAEIRGQFIFNQFQGRIQPRSVTRFSSVIDPHPTAPPTVQAMTPITAGGFVEPLSRFGSRLMTVWRYCDLGFNLLDDQFINLDVEGLNWAPFGGQNLLIDNFPSFRMALAHSKFLPDEFILPGPPPAPAHPLSGLVQVFDDNLAEPLQVVHPKSKGYLVQPLDSFFAATGTLMAPWPLNRGIPQSQYVRWTFRDTAKIFVGAPNGQGADIGPVPGGTPVYGADLVPTVGLPLLMEFRTYPAMAQASGTNIAFIAQVNNFGVPFFRVHSTGGFDTAPNANLVDPDTATTASGGWLGGAQTPPQDNGFYYGQADFVVRVNRVHTIWFDTGSASNFVPPSFEPPLNSLPTGTSMSFAFRGASALTNATTTAADAANYDPYGNALAAAFVPQFLAGDATWKSDPSQLDGARFVQARITLTSNPVTTVYPELSAISIPFYK